MKPPLVSICTPTWNRRSLLLSRCVPSIQAQTHPEVEHIIVSDGPDEELRGFLAAVRRPRHPIRYFELAEHAPEPNFGHYARVHAVAQATGTIIAYNDDDDELGPEHCALMAKALEEDPDAEVAISRMISHGPDDVLTAIGWGPLACGNVGTPMIAHRKSALSKGTWGPPSRLEDWELVKKWIDAGIKIANVDRETCNIWPSIYR
jgi:glycosyltransferase involved in cell wall biosynthesis